MQSEHISPIKKRSGNSVFINNRDSMVVINKSPPKLFNNKITSTVGGSRNLRMPHTMGGGSSPHKGKLSID